MAHLRTHRPLARRLAWLVWFGLLLPVAQLAAATHALSHARVATGRDEPGPQAPHLAHCDLCLAAAAIGGAAPAPLPASPGATSQHEAALPEVVATVRAAAAAHAYRSRAPPAFLS